jgi:two-component system chemotaxis response regulator CheV
MTKTSEEAWHTLQQAACEAQSSGARGKDSIALVLTDLEMP